MNCEDLMNIKEIKDGMKLVAGARGVMNNIRWVYFADCIQCLDENYNVSEFIHGEELVIITNMSLTENDDIIVSLIDTMREKNVAAFVLNEGQISNKIKDYCDEIELPLYELSMKLHLIDLSQILCKRLVHEENNISSIERLFSTIMYSDKLNYEEIAEQANYLEVSLNGNQRVIVFHLLDYIKKSEHGEVDEGAAIELKNNIKKIIQSEIRIYGLRHLIICTQMDNIAILIPADFFSRDLLINILYTIVRRIHAKYNVETIVGVGTAYDYINEFKNSLQEAKNTLKVSKLLDNKECVFFYDDLGIYSLLLQINNGKFMDDYVKSRLGKLIEADTLQDGSLCITLESYLKNNCNANATAEELFIHRNTMRYRIDKIKGIINDDITDLSTAMELKLAFLIMRYRNSREN